MPTNLPRTALALALLLSLGRTTARADAIDPAALRGDKAPPHAIWLDTLDLSQMEQSWGNPRAGRSVENRPITLRGNVFKHGLGTHAASELRIDLKGVAEQFVAMVGIDDEATDRGSAGFEVWVDNKKVADSGVRRKRNEAKLITADLHGAKSLVLIVNDGGDGMDNDHADWAGAAIVLSPDAQVKPQSVGLPAVPPPDIVRETSPLPAIHGPRITGATPGRPFQFLIPATGEKPLHYAAKNLPQGLKLDADTGIISGSLPVEFVGATVGSNTVTFSGMRIPESSTVVDIEVSNAHGTCKRKLTIVGGKHKLALTPPLGWNSWNCWASAVSDEKVRISTDAMVSSGLAAHGFQYVNIDDCWEGKRDAQGEIQTNKKFPDMKRLADYVHSKGLKLGIYSSPGPKTCAGYEASWKHEQQDADTYAKWGIDYLKYDWCSYGEIAPNPNRAACIKPYAVMRTALDNCSRDIVFSFCQYGMSNVWEWGEKTGGNCWRTTGDITDDWGSMAGIGFSQNGHERYAGPGHWNDPDMLVVGRVGWGPSLHPTRLKPNEQLTHISLWCLLSSPLLIGCDMAALDKFTLALLTNDEVLDVNQDPLGKPAGRIAQVGQTEVWARPLFDGAKAVGLFNRSRSEVKVRVDWADLKLSGPQPVRDLWQHKDLGAMSGGYEVAVPPHGVVLIKVGG